MAQTPLKTAMLAATFAATLLGCNPQTPQSAQKFVALTQFVEHPSLDATRKGIEEELAEAGFKEGETLKFKQESAQGNPSTAAQIATQFVGENPDVIVAIATPSAQAVASATKEIPIVFSAVTDPISAKLASNLEKPGGNVTGVTDLSPIDKHLDLIAEITPQAKRIGVLYNAGETNSITLLDLLKEEAPKRGMTIVEATAANSSGVLTAARSLVGKVDAIYVPTDNTIASALEAVIQVGQDAKLPVYAGDTDSVARGAITGLSFNYYDVGRQTGKVIVQILDGTNPGEIPVRSVEKLELHLNPKSAQTMGVTLPEAILEKADKVIE
ncbi:ABC transporter substrate-binding protein [Lusitaniella coriacea LEGE 07157]|uniref:ABC transporter substrate-binding protein n=1 Tax=Lusitaniella coriacea LEGE 07157 TaxID=945747 RepID=A0A8J7AR51_9CYAN|nr:ABC transporter substrate-binding protein [Lusitaniella coriacea]MBE9114431.1 ABC transporter substrate-binding protein [Lusitaniella coriacea LEGE 07157]